MDLIRSIEIFMRCAERGSFSKAARELNKTQPAISRQIKALENELGCQLFQRTTRSLVLTYQGTQFYLKAKDILQTVSEARNLVSNEQHDISGTLKIAAPVAFGCREVIPLLWPFKHQYPDIRFDIMLADHYIDLVEEGVDLSIRLGTLSDSTLKARRIGAASRYLVASPDYLQRQGIPTDLEQLQQHTLIQFSLLRTPNKWVFTRNKKRFELVVSGDLRINNADGILQALLAHQGIALVPQWLVASAIKNQQLQCLLTEYTAMPFDLHIVFPPGRFAPKAVKLMSDYLVTELRRTWILPS
jgi:DNA-binding transcriptional LysR family regulator